MYFAVGNDNQIYIGADIKNLKKVENHNLDRKYLNSSNNAEYFNGEILLTGTYTEQSGRRGFLASSKDGINWTVIGSSAYNQLVSNTGGHPDAIN